MERTILHCDCNGFYASVACSKNPQLKQVPMAVCGDPESRHGIILAKNELAKAKGIQTAETVWQARKKCPELVLVPPEHDEYRRYSKRINEIYQEYTDLVEPFSIDESWLDVTGSRRLFGDGKQIANLLRKRIREEIGVTISVGVSFNKIFAKLGSDYQKPDATTVINRENFRQILFPLPVARMIYVGKSAERTLNQIGIYTIGQLAQCDRVRLSMVLGKLGDTLWEYANGLENDPVHRFDQSREIKSVGNGMTFSRNLNGWDDIRTGTLALCDTVAARLRRYGLLCCGVQVTIRDPDFHTISRQKQLVHPTNLSRELFYQSIDLIQSSWDTQRPIRMLTITGISLTDHDPGFQTDLFSPNASEKNDKLSRLEHTIDIIRKRYGRSSIQSGTILKNDIGLDSPTPKKDDS